MQTLTDQISFTQMASIQEQLKHIRSANDDWYDEHRR